MILITGGTGLLGSHLLIELTRQASPIRAMYRSEERIENVKKLFQFYLGATWEQAFAKIDWRQGDILDVPKLEELMEGVETVYHSAALVSFATRDFDKLIKINREGTSNVVNTALGAGVKTLAYVSSTAAIGGKDDETSTEDTKWKISPRTSAYSISKYSAEKEVWRGVEEGLDCVIVNPCLIFGPGAWDESSLTIFRTVEKGLPFYTSGTNAIVDVRDVAEILVQLSNSDIRNERFLCIGKNMPIREMLNEIARQLDKKEPWISTPRWLMGLTWRISAIVALFRGKKPTITRASANSAFSRMNYDATKVKERLGIEFRSFEDTVSNAIKGRMS
jgi:dihydroflavonol-4-reductase